MDDLDLANALRGERKTADLLPLERGFYLQVGSHLAALEDELAGVEDHFSVEAQIIEDELKSARRSIVKLIDLRMKKIIRRALRRAISGSKAEAPEGMTAEEEEIYTQILSSMTRGRENILAHIARPTTEKPLTGRKDIGQEYVAVLMLDSVPTFIGVDGKRYILSKEDVVMLPSVHAKNLCKKSLAHKIMIGEVE